MLLDYSRDLDAAAMAMWGYVGWSVIKTAAFLAVVAVLLKIVVQQVKEIIGKSR